MNRLTNAEFIEKLNDRVPNREYEIMGEFITYITPILVKTKYGNCKMSPNNMLNGNNPTITTAVDRIEYLTRQIEDKFGKFSYIILGEYKNNSTKILVSTKYGDCLIKPCVLLSGGEPNIDSAVDKTAYFIKKASIVHSCEYLYGDFLYKNGKDKHIITCKLHGNFLQSPGKHLQGDGCKKCATMMNGGFTKNNFLRAGKDKECIFYVINLFNKNENFYKIGITSLSVSKRFADKTTMPYEYSIIKEIKGNAEFVWNTELKYKRQLKKFRYVPLITFHGCTECFHNVDEIT